MKTRVLHLHWAGGIGGVERWLLTLARRLDRDRFDLTIGLMGQSGLLLDEASSEGAELVEFGWRSGASPMGALRFRRFLRERRFDIVHNHLRTWLVSRALASVASTTKLVMHEHGQLLYAPAKSKAMYRRHGRIYDRFVVTNPEMERRLHDTVPEAEGRTVLIPNPVDTDTFRPPTTTRSGPVVVGGIGRLDEDKAWPLFLDVADSLRASVPDIRFRIVGGGPLHDDLAHVIRRTGLADVVSLEGPTDDPAAFYREIDLLLFTSRREDFGMVIPEALASGVPVVAAQAESGGVRDLLTSLDGTQVADDRNPEAVAALALPWILDRESARAAGTAGRDSVIQQLGAEVWIDRVHFLYESLTPAATR